MVYAWASKRLTGLRQAQWDAEGAASEASCAAEIANLDAKFAREAVKAAQAVHERAYEQSIADQHALAERLEKHDSTIHLLQRRIDQLELTEREENAPIREQLIEKAKAAWGPDHASRPPAAVYDMRGPDILLKSIDLSRRVE